MRRALLLAFTLFLAACSGGGSTPPAGEPASTADPASGAEDVPVLDDLIAPEWHPETRSEELATEIDESGELTRQQAVDVLGLVLPDLPGVTPSDLPPGDGLGDTFPLKVAHEFRDQFTPEQQAVVDRYLDAGTDVVIVNPDGTIDQSGPTPGATSSETTASGGRRGLRRAGPKTGPGLDQVYQDRLMDAMKDWTAYFPGHPNFAIGLESAPGAGGMDALMISSQTCRIRVFEGFTAKNHPDDELRFYFAHELFHCYQQGWTDQAGADWNQNAWIVEGSADWAAADLYRKKPVDYGKGELWLQWFTKPERHLAARAYDAWPLYEDAHLAGLDVYPIIISQFLDPQQGVPASTASMGLDGVVFRMNWSSRTFRDDQFDPEWRLPWPGLTPNFGPHDNALDLGMRGPGTYNVVGTSGYSQRQMTVTMTPDVGLVTVTPSGEPFSTMTALGTKTIAEGGSRTFCFSPDECRCPGGAAQGIPMLGSTMVFSFAAATATAPSAAVRAERWRPEDCDHGGSAGVDGGEDGADGASNGDPHLTSFDGLPFDVMTLGEFVVVRDPTGDLEIQARHEPVGSGAGTTAVAIGTGSHRITFTQPSLDADGPPVLRIDGHERALAPTDVDGVRIDTGPVISTILWPDGSLVEVRWISGWFIGVSLPAQRAERVVGLLGSADGNMRNDLVTPDGNVMDTTDAAADESPYALAWTVDNDSSLFDYEPGQSVATFRIPHPSPTVSPIPPDEYDRCRAALGEGATTSEVSSCAYDVTVTGDADFVGVYSDLVDERVEAHPPVVVPAGHGEPSSTSSSTSPAAHAQAGTPAVTLDSDHLQGTLEASAGTVLVATAASCPGTDVHLQVRVHGDESKLARVALCDPSGLTGVGADSDDKWIDGEAYVWLPGDETYDIEVQTLGPASDVPDIALFADPTPTVVDATRLGSGDERTLQGVGDTAVYLLEPGRSYDVRGLLDACTVEVYWSDTFPRPEPVDLKRCDHASGIVLPTSDSVIPIVVFARTADGVNISIQPAP
jgi:hypothetical protein